MSIYEVLMASVIFYAIFQILKNFTDFLLNPEIQEANKYPSLKWGLVAFFAGIGFIIINSMAPSLYNEENYRNFNERSMLPFGIELVSISFGFIIYFLIVNFAKKK